MAQTTISTSSVVVTTGADGIPTTSTTFAVVRTTVPATTLFSTRVVTSTSSPTGVAGLQEGSSSSNGGGLSTGAKVGIGVGVGLAVLAASILGAVWAMRRRRRPKVSDEDRYTPSNGPSMIGFGAGFGAGAGTGAALGAGAGKHVSRSTASDFSRPSPPMSESNPLDRYNRGGAGPLATTAGAGVAAGAAGLAVASASHHHSNSKASEVSSVSENSAQYRPGLGMAAVPERTHFPRVNELAAQNTGPAELDQQPMRQGYGSRFQEDPAFLGVGAAGYRNGEGITPSEYSDDEQHKPVSGAGAEYFPPHLQQQQQQYQQQPEHITNAQTYELSADNPYSQVQQAQAPLPQRNVSGGMQPGRTQLTKDQLRFDPSQNF